MKKYKVGIVGQGYVGKALKVGFKSDNIEINTYDKYLSDQSTVKDLNELTLSSNIIFICVPTPMKKDGSQDLSYIERVFENSLSGPVYIIKSTILPGTTQELVEKFPKLDIIFSPEFLTERTAKLDMLTQARIVLGGKKRLCNKVKKLFEQRFMNRHYIITDSTTAELIKYMNNTFFATKVSIINEFKRLSSALGANWEDAMHGFAADGRIGDSHLHVPGPDGKLGYGGTCFPKDVNALITMGEDLGTPMNTIKAGWKTNLEVRPEQDWNKLKGRAII